MLEILAALLSVPIALVWSLPLVAEAAALVRSLSREAGSAPGTSTGSRFLVLVPAHDEESFIASCVQSLVKSIGSVNCRIVVVADNCSDRTAAIARDGGVEVIERNDPDRPGKPWAIQHALEELEQDPFDAVVIVDADTLVEPGFLAALDRHEGIRDRAFQGYFGLRNPDDTWLTTLGQVLNLARYEWAFPLKARAGWSVPFTGNAMCLGRRFLSRVGWPVDSLTENWELYARAVERGEGIEFEPQAKIASQEESSLAQGATQRKRWLAGRLHVLRDHWRGLLKAPTTYGQRLDALNELSFPGPVLHGAVALSLSTALLLIGGPAGYTGAVLLASIIPSAIWAVVGVLRHRSSGRALAAMFMLGPYAVWRVAVALVTWSSDAGRIWVRSPRDEGKGL